MKRTTFLDLIKPDKSEKYNIEQFNTNMDAIDSRLYSLSINSETMLEHKASTNNPHNVTKSQVGLSKVENYSEAEILSHLTYENVVSALKYIPTKLSEVFAPTDPVTESIKDSDPCLCMMKKASQRRKSHGAI